MGNRLLQGPWIAVSDSDPKSPGLGAEWGTGDVVLFTFALGLSIRSLVCVQ